MDDKKIIAGVVVLLLIVGGALYITSGGSGTVSNTGSTTGETGTASGPNVAFAQCLKDKGATFFGAFWCPHCRSQKALFGDAVPALPYVECSTPDGKGQTQICRDKKIESYPTWEFADGSRVTGEQSFATLAEKSGCTVPGETAPASSAAASSLGVSISASSSAN